MKTLHKIIYKKYFLFILLLPLVINFHFTKCEVNNSEITSSYNNKKCEKCMCSSKSDSRKSSWKESLAISAGFGFLIFTLFVGTNLYDQWIEGRRLTFIERELEMINLSLTCLVALALLSNRGCTSPQSNELSEDNQKTQPQTQTECSCA